MKISLFIGLLFVAAILGCSTAQEMNADMASFEGRHFSEVVKLWGPPEQIISDDTGGAIMTWEKRPSTTLGYSIKTSPELQSTPYTTYMPRQTFRSKKTRTFWVDPDGVIYTWSWRGL